MTDCLAAEAWITWLEWHAQVRQDRPTIWVGPWITGHVRSAYCSSLEARYINIHGQLGRHQVRSTEYDGGGHHRVHFVEYV